MKGVRNDGEKTERHKDTPDYWRDLLGPVITEQLIAEAYKDAAKMEHKKRGACTP
jgi:hypothetical protein